MTGNLRVEKSARDESSAGDRIGDTPHPAQQNIAAPNSGDIHPLDRQLADLRLRLRKARLRGLRRERDGLVAKTEAERLYSGRAVGIVRALAHWIRRPWRLPRLARDLWRAVRRTPSEPHPRLRGLDRQISALERALEDGGLARSLVSQARAHLAVGDYERAVEALSGVPDSVRRRDLATRAHLRMGELTRGLSESRAALRLSNAPDRWTQVAHLAATLVVTNTRWLPNVGGALGDGSAPRPGVVLHLLKESLPFFERGYTMRSTATLEAQRLAGLSPVVVTSLGFPRMQGFADFAPVEMISGIPHHRLDLGPEFDAGQIPRDDLYSHQATMVDQVAAEARPSVIQASSGYHGFELPLTGLAVGRRRGIPVIYEIRSFLEQTWTADIQRSETREYSRRRSDQETRCLLESDLVITVATTMAEDLEARGVPAEKIRVIPNVVDLDRFQPRAAPAGLAERLGLGERRVLGYVSNLGFREGIGTLVEAVAQLRQEGNDVAGLVVGEGPEREALEAHAADLGIADAVTFTGHVRNEQIEDHYALIDVFVVPRIADRAARLVTPLKPLEAMAMGIPVVASDLPALREMLGGGERGLLFESEDVAGLARQAALLLGDAQRRREIADRARAWVSAERSLGSNVERFRVIFDEHGWG
jgi:glycosyltransferase involved in cell wall biosynthesis